MWGIGERNMKLLKLLKRCRGRKGLWAGEEGVIYVLAPISMNSFLQSAPRANAQLGYANNCNNIYYVHSAGSSSAGSWYVSSAGCGVC